MQFTTRLSCPRLHSVGRIFLIFSDSSHTRRVKLHVNVNILYTYTVQPPCLRSPPRPSHTYSPPVTKTLSEWLLKHSANTSPELVMAAGLPHRASRFSKSQITTLHQSKCTVTLVKQGNQCFSGHYTPLCLVKSTYDSLWKTYQWDHKNYLFMWSSPWFSMQMYVLLWYENKCS